MKIIELTNYSDDTKLYINVDYIGDFYEENDYIPRVLYTKVGVLTHKEGFHVKETPNEIMVKLSKINLLTIINR